MCQGCLGGTALNDAKDHSGHISFMNGEGERYGRPLTWIGYVSQIECRHTNGKGDIAFDH